MLCVVFSQVAAAQQVRVVDCRRIEQAPMIDGELTEAAWQDAVWVEGFVQSVPDFGEASTETTRVAFLHDGSSVFVAVRCDDSSAELIRASKLRHRDNPRSDDHIELIFDTYRDQTRGVVLVVNPLGAKEEGLVMGQFRYNWSWKGVWEARTMITQTGWQAELRVPLRLLRYGGARDQEWGVNIRRSIMRKHEDAYLVAPPPPFDISALNYAAVLRGLTLDGRQRNLQLIPYGLIGTTRSTDYLSGSEGSESLRETGFDLKYSVTSDLTLDATVNTDFAQVESDDEQVNLTRYSLFIPEKREFFLENAQLFSFGPNDGGTNGQIVTPFFSRRIGLHESETVPIDLGLRLTGKAGKQDIGILSVRTGGHSDLDVDSAWYNVARLRRDLGARSYVGGIITDSRRGDFQSSTVGVDAGWFITEPLSLRGYFLRVEDDQHGQGKDAYHLSLDLTTDPWGFLFSYDEVGGGFDPDLGYVRRTGFRKRDGLLRRSWRPRRWGIRRFTVRTITSWNTSLAHDRLEDSRLTLNVEIELERGDYFQLSCHDFFERLFEPFQLDEELSFAPGDYRFYTAEMSYSTDSSKRLGGDASVTHGDFYDGDQRLIGGNMWWVVNRHLKVSGGYSSFAIETDHGDLDWSLWSLRINYAINSNISASSYVQHNSSTGATVLNLRLHWILRNDSDLFVVFNERRTKDDATVDERERDAAVKVSYRFFL
jgi:hypothetical protein